MRSGKAIGPPRASTSSDRATIQRSVVNTLRPPRHLRKARLIARRGEAEDARLTRHEGMNCGDRGETPRAEGGNGHKSTKRHKKRRRKSGFLFCVFLCFSWPSRLVVWIRRGWYWLLARLASEIAAAVRDRVPILRPRFALLPAGC